MGSFFDRCWGCIVAGSIFILLAGAAADHGSQNMTNALGMVGVVLYVVALGIWWEARHP
jgi:hypothetical protein